MIEDLKACLDIVTTLEHFGVHVPDRGRDPVMIRCPWHEDRTPSMAVYRRAGRAWCYGCNMGGDVIDVTAVFLGGNVREAVTYWRERLGLYALPSCTAGPRRRDIAAGFDKKVCKRREERHYRALARLASREVERDIPRPRRPEDLGLYDLVYGAKDAIDDDVDRVCDFVSVISYLWDLTQWRRDSLRLLRLHGIRERGRGYPVPSTGRSMRAPIYDVGDMVG